MTYGGWDRQLQSDEVACARGEVVALDGSDVVALRDDAAANASGRMRLCAHGSVGDAVHEMFIVHRGGSYVRPHRHSGKSESLHVVEGSAKLVVFAVDGTVVDVIDLGERAQGRCFYARLNAPAYHTLLIESPVLVFHEVVQGPFEHDSAEYAPWAPDASDESGVAEYLRDLQAAIAQASTADASSALGASADSEQE